MIATLDKRVNESQADAGVSALPTVEATERLVLVEEQADNNHRSRQEQTSPPTVEDDRWGGMPYYGSIGSQTLTCWTLRAEAEAGVAGNRC
jgi:hypothetical protein